MSDLPTIYYGSVISPEDLTSYKALPRCLIAVTPAGVIDWIVEDVLDSMVQDTMSQKGYLEADVVAMKDGEFIMPGFIDTHTHAPQFPNMGSGQQYELLEWLNKVTFPMEAKFSGENFARRMYQSVVRRVIDCGTTTCCYYGSLHLGSTKVLADIVHNLGQRAFVGKCNMDREAPDYYKETSKASIDDTRAIIAHIRALDHHSHSPPLVRPILTPRFAISCTDRLLSELGELAACDTSLNIQTHISENVAEVALAKKLFPFAKTYAGIYDHFGLLRENTILGHAVHLENDEVELIRRRGAGISHCPTSNFNLSSGVARVGYYLDHGVKVGLGTDVSGGYAPSILKVIQDAITASKVLAMQSNSDKHGHHHDKCDHHHHHHDENCDHHHQQDNYDHHDQHHHDNDHHHHHPGHKKEFTNRQFSVATLLHLATLGGAQVCNIAKHVGSFAPGKSFDALLVNVRNDAGNPELWGADMGDQQNLGSKEALEGMLEKFMFCGDDRNIERVFVQGRFIGGRAFRK